MNRYISALRDRARAADTLLCVGLDPDPARFPEKARASADPLDYFCRAIIDATAPWANAFKPQSAYFEALGAEVELVALIDYIHRSYPDIPVILDAKRGDIGATAKRYAAAAFERYRADAVTLSPYMGFDTIEPYLEGWPDRGAYLLCRTSNPGGADLQTLALAEGGTVFEAVALRARRLAERGAGVGLVTGATHPSELARVRALAPALPLLVPGVGAQGGDIDAAVAAALDAEGGGMVINSSRAIIYAGQGEDFAAAAGRAAAAAREAINAARKRALAARAAAR